MKRCVVSSMLLCLVSLLTMMSTVSAQPTILLGSTWAPVYTFNNGIVDATKSCPAADWTQIQAAMTKAISEWQAAGGGKRDRKLKTRQVRQLNRVFKRQERNLQNGNCKNCHNKPLCIFFSGVGCPKVSGGGRRELQDTQDDMERNLQTTTAVDAKCSGGITKVDAELNTLQPKLTPSCQALLNAPRQVVCTEYTTDCSIYGFTVVKNSNGAHVADINLTGTATANSFCSSVGEVNINTKTNFVEGLVMLDLTGPIRKSSSTPFAPFSLWTKGKGVTLPPGTYTIKGLSLAPGMSVLTKQATFTVKKC